MKAFLIFLGAALAAAPLSAHEFWVDPARSRVKPGQAVSIHLRIGHGFPGDAFPRSARHRRTFESWHRGRRVAIAGKDGTRPAGRHAWKQTGTHCVIYRSNANTIELPAIRFEKYLRAEGLEHIVALRKKRGDTGPGRETYSRCAKALVVCGDAELEDARVGLPLELVVETFGAKSTVRLYRDGAPQAGALVRAARKGGKKSIALRTDRDGRVVFPMESGTWLVSSVWMTPARKGDKADWESVWTSLTFDYAAPDA